MSYSFTNSEVRRTIETIERTTNTDIETWGRYALVTGGSLLALSGLKRGGLGGAALAAAGMGLIWRGSSSDPLMTGGSTMRERPRPGHGHDHVPGVDEHHGPVTVDHTVTINKPKAEIYAFFRDFSNLPRFMTDVERIDVKDRTHSRWCVRAPGRRNVEWDAEVHDERQDEKIAWRSVGDADIHNSGVVEFHDAPGGRGTEVKVTLRYEPPFGRLGRGIAKLTGHEPEVQLRSNLRRLKQVMEAGEAATARMAGKPATSPTAPTAPTASKPVSATTGTTAGTPGAGTPGAGAT